MKTSEVLNRAADLIEERGWVQGYGWPGADDGGVFGPALCLEGGVMAALGLGYEDYSRFIRCDAYEAVRGYLNIASPFSWNDQRGRTAAEVIEVLRACALIEAAREDQAAAWETYADNLEAVAS